MSGAKTSAPRHPSMCGDVCDFLEEVRRRPEMWIRGRSLEQLQSVLIGYKVALLVHGVDEEFAFWPDGPFDRWLERHGMRSGVGWAVEIQRRTPPDRCAVREFFEYLDEFRRANADDLA